ncbi:MAG: hypothetical protein HWE13_04155 [Gammaproteobacteria bacterium]|nr:hypothetical protein [Gammaproteobacteria bacterium]NVK87290.1 hypothetical protein [Gammaproteobacteria bacterium]
MKKIGSALSLVLALSVFAIAAEQLQDPTRPLIVVRSDAPKEPVKTIDKVDVKETKKNQLMAIIKNKQQIKAIIDSRTVKVGDRINGFQVRSINANNVVLSNNNKTITLTLNKSVKRIHSQG